MTWSSAAFVHPSIPRPIPVVDILPNSWTLPVIKFIVTRGQLFMIFWLLLIKPLIWLTEQFLRLFNLALPISRKHNLDPTYKGFTLRQTLGWSCRSRSPTIHYIWWTLYYLFTDGHSFEHDYLEAWSQFGWPKVHIFLETDHLYVPIPSDRDDEATLKMLRMWYRWLKIKRGPSEILLPKALERVERVQIREKPLVLGATVGTLELGRSGRRLVHFFRNSEHLSGQDEITQIIHLGDEGLEFRREWDKAAVSMVVMTPITMSLIFVAVWSAYFIHQGDERQAVVTSAFTVATYVVTVGALVIAIFAYLDSSEMPKGTSEPENRELTPITGNYTKKDAPAQTVTEADRGNLRPVSAETADYNSSQEALPV